MGQKERNKATEVVDGVVETVDVLQRIFRLRYLERRTLEEVASKVHMDKSTVSRKIENYR